MSKSALDNIEFLRYFQIGHSKHNKRAMSCSFVVIYEILSNLNEILKLDT